MAFDGLVTRGIVNELKNIILHGKIDKIYHPEKNELLLHIHTSSHGRQKLYISCDTGHPGLYLTSETYQNPETPSSFCMLLRKHLVNGRITDIIQHEWERIIEIHFETMDEMGFNINKKLIIEVMGKHSNIILVENDSMRIIDCIKKVSFDVSRARQILPGMKYMVPPSQNKIPPDYLNNSDIDQLESASTSKYILDMIQGISPVIARQIADKEHRHIYLNKIINKISIGDITPAVYFKENDEPADFHIIELTDYNNLKHKVFSTISEMIEYYYTNRESSNRVRQKASDLTRHINTLLKKMRNKKQNLLEDILQAEDSEKYKLYGELLTASLHTIKSQASSAEVLNYYTGEKVVIPLDKKFSPAKNAQNYFKKYSKAKTAIIEKNLQLASTEKDINYLESVQNFIEMADNTQTIDEIRDELTENGYLRRRKTTSKSHRQPIKPYEYTTSDGFKILAGRNNIQNDFLTIKKANKNDLWFHTKDIPGSHIILFSDSKKPSDIAILEAAAVAAYHSKGRLSENVPVDYTLIKNVKKPSGAKPGMVIFKDNHTVYVTPSLPPSIVK